MTRHILFTALSLCVLAVGCERKEPSGVIDGPDSTARRQTPAGMMALGKNGAAPFLRRAPVALDEYHAFCKATNTDAVQNAVGKQPVTGLDAETAERLAVWRMARPATPTELAQAKAEIGEPAGRLFLVQAWLPGSQGENVALAAKDALLKDAALNVIRQEIADLRDKLDSLIPDVRDACAEHWRKLKPALFTLVDEQNARDELSQTTAAKLLGTLKDVTAARLRLRVDVQTAETDAARTKAIQDYADTLATTRKLLAGNLTDLADGQKTISAHIRDVTTRLERAADIAANQAVAVQADVFARTGTPAPTRKRAEADRADVKEAIAALTKFRPAVGKLPSLDTIARELIAVKAEIAQLRQKSPADPLGARLVEMRKMLTKPDETIQRQFDQEPLLLKDIDTWAIALAKRDVLAAKLKRLQAYLADATPPAEAP